MPTFWTTMVNGVDKPVVKLQRLEGSGLEWTEKGQNAYTFINRPAAEESLSHFACGSKDKVAKTNLCPHNTATLGCEQAWQCCMNRGLSLGAKPDSRIKAGQQHQGRALNSLGLWSQRQTSVHTQHYHSGLWASMAVLYEQRFIFPGETARAE